MTTSIPPLGERSSQLQDLVRQLKVNLGNRQGKKGAVRTRRTVRPTAAPKS